MVIEDTESATRTSHSGRRPVSQLVMVLVAGAVVMTVAAGVLVDWSLPAVGASVAAYLAAAAVAVVSMRRGFPFPSLGLGNTVTLGRLALVAALVAPLFAPAPPWGVIGVALAALFLDGFDGWLARKEQRASSFGARLDVEVDSALALILALNATSADALGVWILLLGLPRYLFVAAGLFFRWLNASLPDSAARKVICVIQVGALVTLQLPGLWTWFVVAVLVAVTGLLVWSFGRDIVWQREKWPREPPACCVMTSESGWKRALPVIQVVVAVGLLALVWRLADGQQALALLASLQPVWVAVAFLALSLQTVLSAIRWRITAAPLGIDMGWATALREYYLSQVVNQALPGGILGDAGRAYRARGQAGLLGSGQSVVLERLAGQVALFAVMILAFIATTVTPGGLSWPTWLGTVLGVVVAVGLVAVLGLRLVRTVLPARIARLMGSAVRLIKRVWLSPGQIAPQAALSLSTALLNVLAFASCVWAVGGQLGPAAALVVVPLVLLAMVIPLSVSGWGLREGAAATLLPLAGVAASEALAGSVAFGLVFLISSLPGVVFVRSRGVASPRSTR